MRALVAAMIIALSIAGCSFAHDSDAEAKRRATAIWRENMAVVDESIEFWRGRQDGVAPHTTKQLESAIVFFERLTLIRAADMSYLGPIPDEGLQGAAVRWKEWYGVYAGRLTYDANEQQVIVAE